jgi:hypothetical protein
MHDKSLGDTRISGTLVNQGTGEVENQWNINKKEERAK